MSDSLQSSNQASEGSSGLLHIYFLGLSVIFVSIFACCMAMSDSAGEGDGGPNADDDADADVGDFTSPDADADGGVGFDGDADDDRPPDPGERVETCDELNGGCPERCSNDLDDDEDGLSDCSDLGCIGCTACCDPPLTPWVRGEFYECPSLSECRWTAFSGQGDGTSPVAVTDGGVALGGDGVGEVGLYAEQELGLSGEPTVTFVARFNDESCAAGRCPQVLGLALTEQSTPTAGAGVSPLVGIVIDGEQGLAHYFVSGWLELSVELERASLNQDRVYGFRVNPSGTVSFWQGVEGGDDVDLEAFDETPSYTSTALVDTDVSGLHVAIFGSLDGDQTAIVEQVHVERLVCDEPAGWSRLSTRPVLTGVTAGRRIMAPTVVEGDEGGLLMIYETAEGFEAAQSDAEGARWTALGPVLRDQSPVEYGALGRHSPALLRWTAVSEDEAPSYHLWYQAIAARDEETPVGVTPTAICHASSHDGIEWVEDIDSVVSIEGDVDKSWMIEVDDPTVVVTESNELVMIFIGRDPVTGSTTLLRATSMDGKQWVVGDDDLLGGVSPWPAFARDGIAEPMILRRQGVFSLWFTGLDGARSTIGYAVSGNSSDWELFGRVFEPEVAWEANRVGAPAVLLMGPAEAAEGFEALHLWYVGGTLGRESVGLALREVPDLDVR